MRRDRARDLAHRTLVWLAPSAVAAALAALVAGLIEGALAAHGALEVIATAGFGGLLGVPVLFAGAALARGVWAGWQPHQLAAQLVDERGAAPRLMAWAIYLGIAAGFLSWATFNSIRWLAIISSFKPVVVALATPILVLAAGLATLALSRPLVDLIAAGLARWERRRAAAGTRAITTPWITLALLLGGTALSTALSWLLSIRPRVGHVDLRIVVYPVTAIAAAVAVHAAWRRAPARRGLLAIAALRAGLILLGVASAARIASPTLVLDVWSRPTIAGRAVDELFDLDELRAGMALTAFRPVARGDVHPDVILVTIDTVRADRTPLAGGGAKMPILDTLGARGAVFEWAFSPGNATYRSIPSLVLGVSATRARGRVAGSALKLDPRHVVLAERFHAAGYDTAGFVCCDAYWQPNDKLGISRGLDHLVIDRRGQTLVDAARAWIAARDARTPHQPLFVWVHFVEPDDWNGDQADVKVDEAARHRYDVALGQVDRFLGELMGSFANRPPSQQPLVVVTADHGEGLGDHGVASHGIGLYDSQTRVPLVFLGPGVQAHRVTEPVALVDLAPTLLELAGFVPPGMPEMDGRSIADLVGGRRPANPNGGYAFMAQIPDRSVANGAGALVVGRWKLIDDGDHRFELYDLRADPGELNDLSEERLTELDRMKKLLEQRAAIDDVSPFP